jgi:hypothetical protein
VLAEVGVQVRAVRLWLLVRASTLEVDHRDEAHYRYANLDYTVDGRADMPQGYRRLLITQTVTLRNL